MMENLIRNQSMKTTIIVDLIAMIVNILVGIYGSPVVAPLNYFVAGCCGMLALVTFLRDKYEI